MPTDRPASPTTAPHDQRAADPTQPDRAPTWLDDLDVDPQWSAPGLDGGAYASTGPTPASRRKSRWTPALVVTVIVVSLALVVGGVWALGGFEKRTDLLIDRSAGDALEAGPYVFTFTGATAQKTTDFNDEVFWEVLVNGTGLTTGDISIAPPSSGDDAFFVSRDPDSKQVKQPYYQRIGEQMSVTETATTFTPGLPPTPFQIEFRYDDTYVPGQTLQFLAFQLEFVDDSLLGDQDKQWRRADRSYQLFLPVTVLPEKKS